MRKLILFPVLLLASLTIHAQSQRVRLISPGQVEVEALHGLDSIVIEVKSDIAQSGFEPETIKQAIEKYFKSEHLPVVDERTPASARLVVTLNQAGAVALVRMRLLRAASMKCGGDSFMTPMWERERLGRGASALLTQLIAAFVDDYNSINRR